METVYKYSNELSTILSARTSNLVTHNLIFENCLPWAVECGCDFILPALWKPREEPSARYQKIYESRKSKVSDLQPATSFLASYPPSSHHTAGICEKHSWVLFSCFFCVWLTFLGPNWFDDSAPFLVSSLRSISIGFLLRLGRSLRLLCVRSSWAQGPIDFSIGSTNIVKSYLGAAWCFC